MKPNPQETVANWKHLFPEFVYLLEIFFPTIYFSFILYLLWYGIDTQGYIYVIVALFLIHILYFAVRITSFYQYRNPGRQVLLLFPEVNLHV